MISGEEKAWQAIESRNPEDLADNAGISYDAQSNRFSLLCFGHSVSVYPADRRIEYGESLSSALTNSGDAFFGFSLLHYLAGSVSRKETGTLIHPKELPGGIIFVQGTHMLPLGELARKYGEAGDRFIRAGAALGGEKERYGDASIRLHPFPRVPVVLVLWKKDDEFQARADLLFDASVRYVLPVDVAWATAVTCITLLL